VGVGYFCMAVDNYLEHAAPTYPISPSRLLLENRLYVAPYFLLAIGVLFIGLGWSIYQVSTARAVSPPSGQRSRGWIFGLAMVVVGFVLVTATLLYDGITSYLFYFTTSTFKPPQWSYWTTWAVIGLGILFWVLGWVVMRWPDGTANQPT
jgi:hypothetical protein